MASIHKEIEIERSKESVWDAIRDVGAIHKRLVPGFVVDCNLEGNSRIVTFANGMVLRELIIDVDDGTCRHSWSARGEPLIHHNASVQVLSEGVDRCRIVWIADFLPNELAETVGEMIGNALETMKRTLESNRKG
jgi:Polyketide cyclase / dehydrase and lipid transport